MTSRFIRKRILQTLYSVRGQGLSEGLDSDDLARQIPMTWDEIRHEVEYLEEKGYIDSKTRQIGARLFRKFRLTAKGVDELEGVSVDKAHISTEAKSLTEGGNIVKREASLIKEKIDFAIITAVEVERLAVCKSFGLTAKDRVRKGSRVYWRGRLLLKNGEFYELVVAQSSDMANIDTAIIANDTLHHWNPTALLLVGIAGAAHDGSDRDDEALGDVILGSHVYYYERGKETDKGKTPEPYMYPADATLWNNRLYPK